MTAPSRVPRTQPVLHLVKDGQSEWSGPVDFDALFRRYSTYVATIGLRLLGRDSEVDDLVQEVFLVAHRGLRTVRDPQAIRGWLATVCVRRAMRRLRARRLRHFLSLDGLAELEEPVSSFLDPEAAAELAHLYRKLDTFPASERVVWTLRHGEGESLDTIARMCRCSKSTVQRRLRSAEARLERERNR